MNNRLITDEKFMKKKYSILLYFFCLTLPLFGQPENYNFRKISTADGLSQSSVIAITQDHLGQMWLGTRDGLNKYDGHSFTIYKNESSDSLSISNNDILSIREDKEGYLWVGTYDGLNRYDPKFNRFSRYFQGAGEHSLKSNTIWCMEEIGGEMWFGTSNGVSIFDQSKGLFKNLRSSLESGMAVQGEVHSILKIKDSQIWIGTSEGLYFLRHSDSGKFHVEKINAALFVQDLVEGTDNSLWVATKNDGLYRISGPQGSLNKFQDNNIHKDIRALSLDKKGNLWVGTYQGVNVITKELETIELKSDPHYEGSLSKNTIKSIFTDRKGSVWIGAYYGGVNIWDESNSNFQSYNQNSGNMALSYDVVSSIAHGGNDLYFGTEGGGVTILNERDKDIRYVTTATEALLPSNNIKSLLHTGNSLLWIGTFNAGLVVYDLKNRTIAKDLIDPELQHYLKNSGVYALKKEEDDIYWIGSFGKGLIRYDRKKKEFIPYKANIRDENFIISDNIRSILVEEENSIWAGTDKGLNHIILNEDDSNIYKIERFLFDKQRLNGEDILTLFKDTSNRIWIGTKYNGLFYYTNNKLKKVDLRSGKKKITAIHAIIEDSQENLWLSSNQGIIQYNIKQDTSNLYSQKDGLISNEFNDNAALVMDSKGIYFGGPSGVSFFRPAEITKNQYAPKVILTDFKIQNESVDFRQEPNVLKKSITYTDKVTLDYNNSSFSIDFAIPNFISSGNNRYAYRLKGLEEEWNITSVPQATYVIQNPGSYTFEVKGANNDGVWNEDPRRLAVSVKPAPWRSIWAFLLYGVLIGAALYGLIKIKKSKAQLKHKLELEKIEREKNQEVNRTKLEFFTNISHEFRTPLTLILGPLQQLLEDYKGSNLMYKKLLVIESSANHLLELINRLMDFRKLENNQFQLQAAEGNIVKFLKEIYLSFSEYAETGGYDYSFISSDEEIKLYYDRPKLERVFYNLISNAFRYTPKGGNILIEIEKKKDVVAVKVRDSGIGIPKESLEKIFNRFYEVGASPKTENYNKGTGIGLSIAKNIVKLHKGKITARNQNDGGAVFSVELQLDKNHLVQEDILKDFKFSDDISQYVSQLEKPDQILNEDLDHFVLEEDKSTVLIVEDSQPLRSFMRNLLKAEYNIIEAENGKIAIKKVLQYMPDLIISDVIMPEMVGTELCSQIKKNIKTSHIPVILLTSRSALVYKFEGLESGADDYISKPFNVKEFMLRIQNLIGSTQRLKEKFSNDNNLAPGDLTVSSLDERLLKKALSIVEENISNEQFNIPMFSSELGVSRTMLFTKIKAWTNFTPNEFIQEIRMKRAAQLLEQGKINVSQISYKVGFKNPKYFAKCFQKKFGLSPTQYSNKFYEDLIDT